GGARRTEHDEQRGERAVVDRRDRHRFRLCEESHLATPPTGSVRPTSVIVAATDGLITSSTGPGKKPSRRIATIRGTSTVTSRTDRSGKPVPARRAAIAGSIIAPGPPAGRPARTKSGPDASWPDRSLPPAPLPSAARTALPRTGPCMVCW